MVLITTNPLSNLVLITFVGHVQAAQLRAARAGFEQLLSGLRPGVAIISDLERADGMEADCAPEIGKVMEMCDRHGTAIVLRIIPRDTLDIGMNILSAFHYSRRPQSLTCKTMAEALAALEKQGKL